MRSRVRSIIAALPAVSLGLGLGCALAPALVAQGSGVEVPLRAAALGQEAAPLVRERSAGPVDIIVVLAPGHSIDPLLAATGTTLVDSAMGVHLVRSPAGLSDGAVDALVDAMNELPGTVIAQPDGDTGAPELGGCSTERGVSSQQCTIPFADGTPTTVEYVEQDALQSIGLADALDKVAQYQLATGAPWNDVVVAVLDTGVDPGHPALAGRLAGPGWDALTGAAGGFEIADGLDGDGDGYVDEAHGHGTHVASVVALVAPAARVLPVRVLDSDGQGSVFRLVQGIYWAIFHGADVINLSLSMTDPAPGVGEALEYARLFGLEVFTSSGNTGGTTVLFPASYDADEHLFLSGILPLLLPVDPPLDAVSAVDAFDVVAAFSAVGADVDLCAPGVDVYGAMPGGGWAWWSGTSMSTAIVSGAAALVLGVDDGLVAGDVLEATAVPIDALNPPFAGLLGAGRVDVSAAVSAAITP